MEKSVNSLQVKEYLQRVFTDCGDFNIRFIVHYGKKIYFANLGGFSARDYISENIIKPIVSAKEELVCKDEFMSLICANEVKELAGLCEAKHMLLGGFCVAFTDFENKAVMFACMARSEPSRGVSEPHGEVVVRGPREGFNEKAEDSSTLLRKRLRTENLKIINLQIGNVSDTTVKMAYLDGVADKGLVDTLKNRLENMPIATVMDSGYIEQYLLKGGVKLFTEIGNSEKPDKVAAKIAEGRVAIICDGSPVVLTAPYLFIESLQSAEDYLKTPFYATFIRLLRLLCLVVSLYLPAFYVSVMEYHKNSVSHKLYLSMMGARENVPFSVFGELIVILVIFELIREVGVRMPGSVGGAVSIVGGLVLGDAAISAGISSAPVIMIASLTAICTFILPPFMNSIVLIRLLNIVLAKVFGMLGIAISLAVMIMHLCCKKSFGVNYLYPFMPLDLKGLEDTIYSNPVKTLK